MRFCSVRVSGRNGWIFCLFRQELINLLDGTIKVKSSEKEGVSFRLYFPITLADAAENEIHKEYKEPVPVEDKIEPFIPIDRSYYAATVGDGDKLHEFVRLVDELVGMQCDFSFIGSMFDGVG